MLGRVRDEAIVSRRRLALTIPPGPTPWLQGRAGDAHAPPELCRGSEGCLTLRTVGLEWDLALGAVAVRRRGVHLTTRAAHGHTLRHGGERGSVRSTGRRLDHSRRKLMK